MEPDRAVSLREWPSLRLLGTPKLLGKALGFLPDDTAFVSIQWPTNSDAAEVVWWSVPDWNAVRRTALAGKLLPGTVCELSPDGRLLATGGTNNEVRVFNLADGGKLLAQAIESEQDDGYATVLAFAPDSRLLAAGFGRSTPVNLWDMTSAHGLVRLKGHVAPVLGLVFAPDGRTLFSGSGDLRLWDVAGHKELTTFPNVAGLGALSGLDLSPDGKTLAATSGWKVQLWNVVTRREVARFGTTADVSSVSFAPDGTALFITEQPTNGPVTLIKRAPGFAETDAER
jgi:WD40 repeat protein